MEPSGKLQTYYILCVWSLDSAIRIMLVFKISINYMNYNQTMKKSPLAKVCVSLCVKVWV